VQDPLAPTGMPPPSDDTPIATFHTPRSMTPAELGDSLARLVWESFTDFISNGDTEVPLSDLGVWHEDGVPDAHATEEALIFLLWAHTRAVQLAFANRARDVVVRRVLDHLHRAVFEDMVEHGTPRSHLPIFEQRVASRYQSYHDAAERSDRELGRAAVRHLTGEDTLDPALAAAASERAIAAADPLRDFLQDVDLVEPG